MKVRSVCGRVYTNEAWHKKRYACGLRTLHGCLAFHPDGTKGTDTSNIGFRVIRMTYLGVA